MNLTYIIIISIFLLVLFFLLLIRKIFSKKSTKKVYGGTKKKIRKLKELLLANPKDYVSMYQLALLEDEIGDDDNALKRYEELLSVSFFQGKEEVDICQKIENYYRKLENKEMAFKYAVKISKLDSNNMYYAVKIGSILGKEGSFVSACYYFNKAMLAKDKFDIEDIRIAVFCFFKIKEYKKCIVFLEDLYKRVYKDPINAELGELENLQKNLISMYILSEELNIARSFIEQVMVDKTKDRNHIFYIDKVYLFILYKLVDSDKFKDVYDNLYLKYKIKNYNIDYYSLILDYCFYSYFLKDMSFCIKSLEALNSFDLQELKIYDIAGILKYVSEINDATSKLNKLRNVARLDNSKNDNYEKYVDKNDIDNWERVINLWEASFIDTDYILSLVEVKKTMNVEKILEEFKIDESFLNNEMDLKVIKKVDKIYNLSKMDFKKLCQNIIRSRLAYSIVQEYTTDAITDKDYGDEVNYLTYHVKGNRKDLTLISFKRWKRVEIGELMIRDFLMLVNESGAKNGILIVPVKLSSSAKSYALHNDKITVYTRSQFNNLIKDENF